MDLAQSAGLSPKCPGRNPVMVPDSSISLLPGHRGRLFPWDSSVHRVG